MRNSSNNQRVGAADLATPASKYHRRRRRHPASFAMSSAVLCVNLVVTVVVVGGIIGVVLLVATPAPLLASNDNSELMPSRREETHPQRNFSSPASKVTAKTENKPKKARLNARIRDAMRSVGARVEPLGMYISIPPPNFVYMG